MSEAPARSKTRFLIPLSLKLQGLAGVLTVRSSSGSLLDDSPSSLMTADF